MDDPHVTNPFSDLEETISEVAGEPDSPSSDPLSEFVAIELRLRAIDEEAERLKKRRSELEESILNEWADRGQQNARVGSLIVFIRSDFICGKKSAVATEEVCQRLRQIGLGGLVGESYSPQSLKARVKEWLDSGDDVPPELAEVIDYQTIPRLRSRRA